MIFCSTGNRRKRLFHQTVYLTRIMKTQWLPWWSLVVYLLFVKKSFQLSMETVILNYSSRNLSGVPPDLPLSVQYLDLSQNQIRTLDTHDFRNIPNLQFLNLSCNVLEDIHPATFLSTPGLATLDLSHNRLQHLANQQYLLQAQSLEYLDLSSNLFVAMKLGREFCSLTNLKWLGLSAKSIRRKDFASISDLHLHNLFIQAQNLKGYETGSLTGAKSEKIVVIMPNNIFDDPIVTDALASFKEVELSRLFNPEDFLSKLVARRAAIQTVHLHISSLWSTWKLLTSFFNSALISPIRQFSVSNVTLHKIKESCQMSQNSSLDSISIRQASVTVFYFNQEDVYNLFINMPVKNATFTQSPIVHMTCPLAVSMMEMLDLSDCVLTERVFSKGPQEECDNLTNLKMLVLKGNNLRQLMPLTARVQLMSSLKYVDFSRNSLTYEEDQGRCTWPSKVSYVDLSFNAFDQTVFKCLPKAVFSLSLQNNQISAIPVNISGLDSLRVLDLTSNRLLDLPDCLGFPKMQTLLLQRNFLHTPSTRFLSTCPHLTTLDISKNPYICTCPLREFTTRIDEKGTLGGSKTLRISLVHWPFGYCCSYPEYWRNMKLQDFRLPRIACNPGLLAVTILIPAFTLVIAVGMLCHRLDLPWYMGMIWKWTRAKHRSRTSQNRPEELQGINFHAFVSYSQRNADWVKGQLLPKLEGEDSNHCRLRVCHHERDFIPGKSIVQNILFCIEQSRCCIFVLSSHFVQSEWCHYELYFASHQRLMRGLDNIILIMLEPLPAYLIPSKYYQLKAMMARRTYLEWPQDKSKQRMFWANLRAALQADLNNPISSEVEEETN